MIPTYNNLIKFESEIQNSYSLSSYLLANKHYLDHLLNIFNQCELNISDLNNFNNLNIIFRIVRHIISIASNELLELLLTDQYYFFIFGAW